MRKFTEIPDSPAVADIISRLRDAGIEAEVSRGENVMTIYGGGFPAVGIWVGDDADDAFVKQVIADCSRRQYSEFCPKCGYDLSGHAGDANCPECGSEVYASEGEVTCDACGEENPGSFETCWNCDESLAAAHARAAIGGKARRPLPPGVEEVAPDPASNNAARQKPHWNPADFIRRPADEAGEPSSDDQPQPMQLRELIIVILLIALLMGMLLPVLGAAANRLSWW